MTKEGLSPMEVPTDLRGWGGGHASSVPGLGGCGPLRTWRHFQAQPSPSVGSLWAAMGPGGFPGALGDTSLSLQTAVSWTHPMLGPVSAQFCRTPRCRGQDGGLLRLCPDVTEAWGGRWPPFLGLWRFRPSSRALSALVFPSKLGHKKGAKEFHWSGKW